MRNTNKNSFYLTMLVLISTLSFPPSLVFSQTETSESLFSDLMGEEDEDDSPEYLFNGDFTVEQGTHSGTLNIILQIKSGWHGYSQKQLSGQSPTIFYVSGSDEFKIVGPFTPDKLPHAKKIKDLGDVEEFEGRVTWSAPVEFAEDANLQQLSINILASGQVCKQSCIPFGGDQAKMVARFSRFIKSTTKFVSDHGSFSGSLDKTVIVPGGKATLTFSAAVSPDWHVYKLEEFKKKGTTPQPTIIYFTKPAGFKISSPQASKEPIQHETGIPGEKYSYYHEDSVDWELEIESPGDAKPGEYSLEGVVLLQFCTSSSCDKPTSLSFKVPVVVGEKTQDGKTAIALSENELDRDESMLASKQFWAEQKANRGVAAVALSELALYLVMAFFAGLILNAMPCVLPVIGLKVMSFVQQAGEKRGKIFMLNLVFSLGLLTVFLVLATLSTFFGYGWGDFLTKSMTGAIIITGVVFAFGLSMLGVWEIPIPGMSGSSSIGKQAEEEGLLGAYFLGILTTVLATPCTGPLLIPAVTFTAGQPAWIAYLIFTTIGLGMALPYLMVGIFPGLISWLPRPGAWMNTFKQVTGFILMATVVFLMSSFAGEPRNQYLVAMMTTLLCISFGCWWIGRTSIAAERPEQLKAWGTGLAIIAVGSFVAFAYMGPSKYELDWQQYSKAKLGELLDDNRIVFIDFTGPN